MFSKLISTVVGDKRQWRSYKARVRRLPPAYRTAVEALERYLMYFGGGGDGMAMFADLIDLFEQAAADGTPVRDVVGDDPVEFVETFAGNYPKGQWIIRERRRLSAAIDRATAEVLGNDRATAEVLGNDRATAERAEGGPATGQGAESGCADDEGVTRDPGAG